MIMKKVLRNIFIAVSCWLSRLFGGGDDPPVVRGSPGSGKVLETNDRFPGEVEAKEEQEEDW
jgi:hypothetical protein